MLRADLTIDRETKTNPRGIPCAPFVDRVEDYVSSREEVEGTLKNFQEMISCVLSRVPMQNVWDIGGFGPSTTTTWIGLYSARASRLERTS